MKKVNFYTGEGIRKFVLPDFTKTDEVVIGDQTYHYDGKDNEPLLKIAVLLLKKTGYKINAIGDNYIEFYAG